LAADFVNRKVDVITPGQPDRDTGSEKRDLEAADRLFRRR
jgi:hypothetical protein